MPKLYTVAEANGLLPELTPLLGGLREQATRLAGLQGPLREARRRILHNGQGEEAEQQAKEAATLERRLQAGLARLQELNIELKDLEVGLIDFYHERAGRVVFLCWRLGEPEVAYWHDLDTGFAGRQPL